MDNTSTVSVIREELKRRKMTYKELSEISGVPIDTLNNFFRGKTKNPRIDTVEAIERALGLGGGSGWTAEERAAGVVESVRVSMNSEQLEWKEIGDEIFRIKGAEYMKTLKELLISIIEKG